MEFPHFHKPDKKAFSLVLFFWEEVFPGIFPLLASYGYLLSWGKPAAMGNSRDLACWNAEAISSVAFGST